VHVWNRLTIDKWLGLRKCAPIFSSQLWQTWNRYWISMPSTFYKCFVNRMHAKRVMMMIIQLINISECCLTWTGNKGPIEAGRWGSPLSSMQPSSEPEDLAQNLFHSVSLDIHSWSVLVKIESHGNGGSLNAEVNSEQRCGSLVACAPKAFTQGP